MKQLIIVWKTVSSQRWCPPLQVVTQQPHPVKTSHLMRPPLPPLHTNPKRTTLTVSSCVTFCGLALIRVFVSVIDSGFKSTVQFHKFSVCLTIFGSYYYCITLSYLCNCRKVETGQSTCAVAKRKYTVIENTAPHDKKTSKILTQKHHSWYLTM